MNNLFFFTLILVPMVFGKPVDKKEVVPGSKAEEPINACALTFSFVNQDYYCCNTDESGCACVELVLNGLYSTPCNIQTFWWDSPYLCDGFDKHQPNRMNPTLYLNLYDACSDQNGPPCSTVQVPITLHYGYHDGYTTHYDSYTAYVTMTLC